MIGKINNLRVKAILLISIFLLVMNIALGAALIRQSRSSLKELIDNQMLGTVNSAAAMMDGDALERITEESVGSEEYDKLYKTLSVFQNNTGLKFIYAVREAEDGSFILIIDPATEETGEYGLKLQDTEALRTAGRGTPAVDNEPYKDRFGEFYSAYSPVFNSSGKVAGIIATDFEVEWYENQLNRNTKTVFLACILFLAIGIVVVVLLTGQYSKELKSVGESVNELEEELDALTHETSEYSCRDREGREESDINIQNLNQQISDIRDNLRYYTSHATTQANSMITAMASDYRAVYYVNLDENDGVCYRGDPKDPDQTPEGIHFNYLERFTYYAEQYVVESYREEFLRFIEPDNIRESLSDHPLIAYRYLAKTNGREYYEMIRMAGVRRLEDRNDHIVHAIGLGLSEIDTEMREAMAKNEALAEALNMAEEANIAKTSFLSNMSHEIRTPMNAIIGLDSLALRDETINEHTRDYLEKIGGSARHLLDLINNILDMSRIESGRLVLKNEEFSFHAMLDQINTMVMSQCRDKGLKYECRILSEMDEYYIGDDMKLKEVILNILSNAIKFTDAPGSVTQTVELVSVFEDRSTIKFCIKDTGIGMDKEYIPKIFEPFSQEDGSRKNKYGSTGLGMAITRNIVEMMNGSITVESEKGVGTEFTVMVTLRNCEHQEDLNEEYVDLSKLHVLVVDDDDTAAEYARVTLDEAGIRADVALSGTEALQMMEVRHVKQEPYNLVLMDWRMPGMDGFTTAKRIRELYGSESNVIMLTGYSRDDLPGDAMNTDVDSFLTKPLSTSGVVTELQRIMRRSSRSLFLEKQKAELAGRRVLLAEDIELNAEIMMDILSMEDVEADHAENGRIALDMFRDSEPGTYSAILMDVRMPEMDGLEAAAAIRALDRPDAAVIPIIALTANAFDEDVQRSLQAGMNAHLSKPVESDLLYQTLEELIYEAENHTFCTA